MYEFPAAETDKKIVAAMVARTTMWAKRAMAAQKKLLAHSINPGQMQWGIVQGAIFEDLRKQSAEEIRPSNFPGTSPGGLASVGELPKQMYQAKNYTVPIYAHAT